MSVQDPYDDEPRLLTRRSEEDRKSVSNLHPHNPSYVAANLPGALPDERVPAGRPAWASPRRLILSSLILVVFAAILGVTGFFIARYWIRSATYKSLPQIDGSLAIDGLAAPVTVQRDAQGVPHIHAQSLDDLVFAQAFVTAQDRLFQMDTLRRHAAGELAEILGSSLVAHDRMQRTLQIRAAADRAVDALPADQLHLLEMYARGVNASIAQQSAHLPIEFRLLGYKPAPWTPRDSVLVQLVMFQDLTNAYSSKLAHEALTAEFAAHSAQDLVPDLYPQGSWRDHPPATAEPDLTLPGPPIEEVPLDESQASVMMGAPFIVPLPHAMSGSAPDACSTCFPGSNNWVVSGAHTASGKPLLSNDMHLTHSVPGIWYEADLEAPISSAEPLHVAGVSLPGIPLIVVGHNQHVAWGFTNLGADVQDVYIETTRGSGSSEEFHAVDGSWQPLIHLHEVIKVKHGRDINLAVSATQHGDTVTPILTPILRNETRTLALRWTLYDPSVARLPVYDIAVSHDWNSFLAAFAQFGGPAQNVVYADDQGHIGYHATGRIPMRGAAEAVAVAPPPISSDVEAAAASVDTTVPVPAPSSQMLSGALSAVPLIPSKAQEWSGYIPFEQLPQVFDPPSGIIATANGRVAPNGYQYPITLNWGEAYRTERIYHLLEHRTGLTPADMLAIQTDIYSDFDHVFAQRLAYAIDHSQAVASRKPTESKQLRQAADLLRTFDGHMTVDSSAAAILGVTHTALWPMLLAPHLSNAVKGQPDPVDLYSCYSKDFALEELLMHTPARWLPKQFSDWNDFLAQAVSVGLTEAKAPADLARWNYGSIHQLDIEHPIFDASPALRQLLGRPTGTGPRPQSGDGTTVKQVGRTFGPSERFTADLSDLDHSTLNLVLGQSGNPDSQWFMNQFPAWYRGTTYTLPFTDAAVTQASTHTLTLRPR